jgi:hypothetical protein
MTPRVRQALADAASQPPAGWIYLFSAIGARTAPLVANISGSSGTNQLIVWHLQPNEFKFNEMWMFTADGLIISPLGGANLCLTVDSDNNVVANTVVGDGPTSPPSQLWSWPGDGTIVSQLNGQALTVLGSAEGAAVGVSDLDQSSEAQQTWSFYPSTPLTRILAQPPVPFPTSTDTNLRDAYGAMMFLLVGRSDFDLRGQYLNLAAPLGAWQASILTMPRPAAIDNDDWAAVRAQLAGELTAVIAVQALFENYTTCHQALFSSQEAILNKAISDAGITASAQTSGVFGAILWSICYIALQANPDTGFIANIIQCSMNVCAAAAKGVVASNAFAVEVSALWKLLNQGFDEILAATAVIENDILSDWGRLQATYAEIIAGSPGNLAYATGLTAEIVISSASSFQIAMLQALVPSKYQVYRLPLNMHIGSPPSSCLWNTTDQTYEIASNSGGNLSYPDYMMTNDINGNEAVPPELFYRGQGGWATPIDTLGGQYCVTVTLTNQTNRLVTFNLDDVGQYVVPPWGSLAIPSAGEGNGPVTVNVAVSGVALPSFTITPKGQHPPTVTSPEGWTGYGLTTPVCWGGYEEQSSGSCQITIFTKTS